jgi:hypothetical protein
MASRSREIFVKATHIEIYKKKRIEFKKTKQSKQAKHTTLSELFTFLAWSMHFHK